MSVMFITILPADLTLRNDASEPSYLIGLVFQVLTDIDNENFQSYSGASQYQNMNEIHVHAYKTTKPRSQGVPPRIYCLCNIASALT